MDCPLDYSLCDQVVTCYRFADGKVARSVLEGVWYSYRTGSYTDENGVRHQTQFSLIVPKRADFRPGDRIYAGIGPEITPSQWGSFLPRTVEGLSQVRYVKPCYWQGQLCHSEVGA